jgi:GNAT superfamily N-acetyltransferase
VTPVADRLTAHLRHQLGAWPPPGGVLVTTSPERSRPGWDGVVRAVAGMASPDGAVLSVPAEAVVAVQAAGDDLAAVERALARLLDRPGSRFHRSVLRWTATPSPLPPLGQEVDAADPRVPEWLRPFGGEVLIELDDDGQYLAGVGRKRHDRWCTELAVGTEPAARGRGLARRLVATAAGRVLDEGKVPTYQHEPDNLPSARVAEAVGLADEGLRGLWLV